MSAQRVQRPVLTDVVSEFITLPATTARRALQMHVATAGHGPPLLLLHGAPQTHLVWARLMHKFAKHYRVICPDLRGAGWTEASANGYDPASLVEDLRAIMRSYDMTRVRVVAHDWSAIIAFLLAAQEPGLIERLVIISAPDLFVKPDIRVTKLMLAGWFQLVLPLPVIGPLAIRAGRQNLLRYIQSLRSSGSDHPLPYAALDRQLLRDPKRAKALSRLYRRTIVPALLGLMIGRYRQLRLQVPTLVLMGAEDPAAALMHMGRHQNRTADFQYIQIAGAGHFVIDEAPETVLATTLEFLRPPAIEQHPPQAPAA